MPCYQTNLVSVDLKAADPTTLYAALKALGLKYTVQADGLVVQTPAGPITISNDTAEFADPDNQEWVNKIKKEYALETVKRIAKKFKFSLTAKAGDKIVLRRY